MKKRLALFTLACFLTTFIISCTPQGSYTQTWLPKQHKRVDLSKPGKKR